MSLFENKTTFFMTSSKVNFGSKQENTANQNEQCRYNQFSLSKTQKEIANGCLYSVLNKTEMNIPAGD